MFRDLVVQVSVTFDRDAYNDAAAARLGVTLPAAMEGAAPRRKAEYVAGRVCAARAARALLGASAGEIGGSDHGLPEWPPGLAGSITHTGAFASAALARQTDVRSIGIDAEPVMEEEAVAEVCGDVCLPAERRALAGRFAPNVIATLLFSAKESAAKCLYPVTRRMATFDQLRIEVNGTEDGSFRVELLNDLDDGFREGSHLVGRYAIQSAVVHTGAALLHLPIRRAVG